MPIPPFCQYETRNAALDLRQELKTKKRKVGSQGPLTGRKKGSESYHARLREKGGNDSVDVEVWDEKRKRVERFDGKPTGSKKSSSSSKFYSRPSTSSIDAFSLRSLSTSSSSAPASSMEEWWQGKPIKGTSSKLEKPFLRSAGVPNPCDVRPPDVLKKAVELAKRKWLEREERQQRGESVDYHTVSEQFKAIRMDLMVQRVKSRFTVSVYEIHARLALENGDISEYNQCQTKLKELYQEDWYRNGEMGTREEPKNEFEFAAYRILYCTCRRDWQRLIEEMLQLRWGGMLGL
mmetsp:Transcript_4864/g.10277  ORF Transcript_4864/g.10277 Transcript_4864/m.10277 type:complete len:292 (+) Transcript_4864:564-1439(+)